jgi:hypothetical protein
MARQMSHGIFSPLIWRSGGVAAVLTLFLAPEAMAQCSSPSCISSGEFLNVGPLFSLTERPTGRAMGLGLEVSYHDLFDYKSGLGLGLFTQWQAMGKGRHRFGAGAQVTFWRLGLELGLAHETAGGDQGALTLLQATPFATVGVASLGLRLGIPLSRFEAPRPGLGVELGFVVTLKLPIFLDVIYDHEVVHSEATRD